MILAFVGFDDFVDAISDLMEDDETTSTRKVVFSFLRSVYGVTQATMDVIKAVIEQRTANSTTTTIQTGPNTSRVEWLDPNHNTLGLTEV